MFAAESVAKAVERMIDEKIKSVLQQQGKATVIPSAFTGAAELKRAIQEVIKEAKKH